MVSSQFNEGEVGLKVIVTALCLELCVLLQSLSVVRVVPACNTWV